MVLNGREAVAKQALSGLRTVLARPVVHLRPALVNGTAGVLVAAGRQQVTVIGFTIVEGKIVEIDAIADPERVRGIAAAVLSDV
jgi:hypothetical protein